MNVPMVMVEKRRMMMSIIHVPLSMCGNQILLSRRNPWKSVSCPRAKGVQGWLEVSSKVGRKVPSPQYEFEKFEKPKIFDLIAVRYLHIYQGVPRRSTWVSWYPFTHGSGQRKFVFSHSSIDWWWFFSSSSKFVALYLDLLLLQIAAAVDCIYCKLSSP